MDEESKTKQNKTIVLLPREMKIIQTQGGQAAALTLEARVIILRGKGGEHEVWKMAAASLGKWEESRHVGVARQRLRRKGKNGGYSGKATNGEAFVGMRKS